MAHGTRINGVNKAATAGFTRINGVNKKVTKGLTLVDGVQRNIQFISGVSLGDYTEGSIIYIPENGANAAFYVAKHNYESVLNGNGRTLVVRKDCYNSLAYGARSQNSYSSSLLDRWFNGDYISVLDETIRSNIVPTKIYCAVGMRDTTITTISREVFAVSASEMNLSGSGVPVEGSALPISNVLKIAYYNGAAVLQWTRTSRASSTANACPVKADGTVNTGYAVDSTGYSRPAFTLPHTMLFDPNTNTPIE